MVVPHRQRGSRRGLFWSVVASHVDNFEPHILIRKLRVTPETDCLYADHYRGEVES